MLCDLLDPNDFTCTGPGAVLMPNPSLTWLLTTDGLVGTPPEQPDIPLGNLNQLFWKLLENQCSIADFVQGLFARTYGTAGTVAPAVDVIPDPLAGAPAEPDNSDVHVVVYNDYEVTYRYDAVAPAWVEVARLEKLVQTVSTYEATVTVDLEEGDTESVFSIPTETDALETFAFAMKDLSLIYINNADEEMPFVGLVPGFNITGPVVRIALSAAIPVDSTYQLIAIFRRTTVS